MEGKTGIRMFTPANVLTLCNLLCGCAAIVFCLGHGDMKAVLLLVIASAVFDFLDGFTARLTKTYSDIGKQLDSLADMVSFGAVPSAVLFTVYSLSGGSEMRIVYGMLTASVALFSALRLAKFNIDENQSHSFTGLPTPACALFVVSAAWLWYNGRLAVHPAGVLVVSLILSYLLVCPLKMFALKFEEWSWKNNMVRYLFVAFSALGIAVWKIAAVPFIITGYILISAVIALACKGGREGAGNA